ncbi:HNH endonuclease signature motif containing protein [Nocardia sp. NPDC047654]|uniref:HNH endonuclease signature motif containing protein n=1 Tax=Nocardia sp. NPDC047654 TaxID=3364314 RepID=UPI00371B894A
MAARLAGDTPAEKLALNSVRDGECLRWTGGHVADGYGQVQAEGRKWRVHRLAWVLAHGDIPEGLVIGHARDRGCRFRDCFRIDHLEAMSTAECWRRGMSRSAITARTGVCQRGHAMTEVNVYTEPGSGDRRCRECRRAVVRAYRARQSAA